MPRSILEPEERRNHRPRNTYQLRIRTAADVEKARALNLPMFALTDSMITMLGYPMRFPPLILAPRTLRDALITEMPVIEFTKEDAVLNPRAEDLVVAMLRFDPLASRAIAERSWDLLDPQYLMKRIIQEDLEEEATRVRFQDLLPSLPTNGKPMPEWSLRRVLRKNRPHGLIP